MEIGYLATCGRDKRPPSQGEVGHPHSKSSSLAKVAQITQMEALPQVLDLLLAIKVCTMALMSS